MATQVALEEAGRRASVCLSHVSALKLRLSVLHDTTQPLSECTKALTLAQANITCTLGRIERITSHFDAVNEIESSLSHSQEPGEIELEELIQSLYRADDSMKYLNDHKQFLSAATYVDKLARLQDTIRGLCHREFEWLLRRKSQRESASCATKHLLSERAIESAALICECLISTGDEYVYELYGKTRSEDLEAHLKVLFEPASSDTRLETMVDRKNSWLPEVPYVTGKHKWLNILRVITERIEAELKLFRKLMPQNQPGFDAFAIACGTSLKKVTEKICP